MDTNKKDDNEYIDGMIPDNPLVFTPRSFEGVFWNEKHHAKGEEEKVEQCENNEPEFYGFHPCLIIELLVRLCKSVLWVSAHFFLVLLSVLLER